MQMSRNDLLTAKSVGLNSINYRRTLNNANPYNGCLSQGDILVKMRD